MFSQEGEEITEIRVEVRLKFIGQTSQNYMLLFIDTQECLEKQTLEKYNFKYCSIQIYLAENGNVFRNYSDKKI